RSLARMRNRGRDIYRNSWTAAELTKRERTLRIWQCHGSRNQFLLICRRRTAKRQQQKTRAVPLFRGLRNPAVHLLQIDRLLAHGPQLFVKCDLLLQRCVEPFRVLPRKRWRLLQVWGRQCAE